MTAIPRLLAFAGSTDADCATRRLLKVLADGARDAGAQVSVIDLRDYPLPASAARSPADAVPPQALALQQLMRDHDGLLVATPEYSGAMPALIRSTLDWLVASLDGSASPLPGKVAGIVSSSSNGLAGLRALQAVRDAMSGLGLVVVPQQVAVMQDKVGSDGQLKDDKQRAAVHAVGAAVARLTAARLAVSS